MAGRPVRSVSPNKRWASRLIGSPSIRANGRSDCGWSERNSRELAVCETMPPRVANTPYAERRRSVRARACGCAPVSAARSAAERGLSSSASATPRSAMRCRLRGNNQPPAICISVSAGFDVAACPGLPALVISTASCCAMRSPESMDRFNRELDGEDGAFARCALDPDRAPVRLHEFAGDPQPKTYPAILPDSDGPLEPAENPFLVLARDADAFVLHGQEREVPIALDPDVYRPSSAELERVEKQVGDDKLEAGRVPAPHHWRIRLHLQRWDDRWSEAISHLPRQRAQVDGPSVQLDASLLQVDGVEKLMDQPVYAQDLAQCSA